MAFSGSARNLIHALKASGCVWHVENFCGILHPWSKKPYIIRRCQEIIDGRLGLIQRYNSSSFCYARNTQRARKIAAAHPGFNACLVYGISCLPLDLQVPTYCYFDATNAQNCASGCWGMGNYSREKISRIIEYERAVFADCRGIFPRSSWAATSVLADYKISPDKIVVAGAGPNHQSASPPHGPYDRQTILFIGREFDRKGGSLILDAYRRTRAKLPEARLVIVGCNPDIHEKGVEVVGLIAKDKPGGLDRLLKLYREASLFCIMSTYEPFGIVVLEAQLSGVPCVLPNRYAFPEMIKDGETGLLVQQYHTDELAAAFCSLLSNPDKLTRMGQEARKYITEHFTWQHAANRICMRIKEDLDRPIGKEKSPG